jgi:hypothetical protein
MRKKSDTKRITKGDCKEIIKLFKKYPKEFKVLKIDEIKKWKDNPNDDYSQVPRLSKIIKKHGQIKPIVVNSKDMICYAGNHVLEAMKLLCQKEIEVVVVEFPSRAAAELYGLADNEASKMTTLNDRAIVKLLQSDRIQSFADEKEIQMITGFDEKTYKSLLMSSEEMPTALPDVDIEGFVPSKTDFIVIQFESKVELDKFKEQAGMKIAHQRVVSYDILRPFIHFEDKSKKLRHKRSSDE